MSMLTGVSQSSVTTLTDRTPSESILATHCLDFHQIVKLVKCT